MKAFIAYKFIGEDKNLLKEKLTELDKHIISATGWETFIFFRDFQNWKFEGMEIGEIVAQASEQIKKSDILIVECSKKSHGSFFEVGFAKALGKIIISAYKKGSEADFIDSVADFTIIYKDFEDFRNQLKEIKEKIKI